MTQRDMMRKLLTQHGYKESAVCADYAKAERAGLVQRINNKSGYSPEGYAAAVWRDGHKRTNPWILDYCRSHKITVV